MVEFIKADLTCMPQIKNESVDLIVCHATIRAINNRPLKAVKALSEFYRVLKKGGWLIIDDESPLPKLRRLRRKCKLSVGKPTSLWLSSSMANITQRYALKKLEFAAKIVGFKDIELQKFEGGWPSEEDMSEWREEMREMINRIDDEDLKAAFPKSG